MLEGEAIIFSVPPPTAQSEGETASAWGAEGATISRSAFTVSSTYPLFHSNMFIYCISSNHSKQSLIIKALAAANLDNCVGAVIIRLGAGLSSSLLYKRLHSIRNRACLTFFSRNHGFSICSCVLGINI